MVLKNIKPKYFKLTWRYNVNILKSNMKKYSKDCSGCGLPQYYSTVSNLNNAIKKNRLCVACINASRVGKPLSEETKLKISLANSK
jgi:hypothetical protein